MRWGRGERSNVHPFFVFTDRVRLILWKKYFFLLSVILFISYSNTFNASWHLDDAPNLLTNSKLHLSKVSYQEIKNALSANPSVRGSNSFYRPLSCLTFSLNWYVGQDNVFGYHVVNITIHILTACFLFLNLNLLLQLHCSGERKYPPQFFLAASLLAALFWALAPIQTQAVTYIVQRMASMAAMFTIISIYAYLKGRTEKKHAWFILSLLSFFAALGSKENAILLPASLVLIELAFFTHQITKRQISRFILSSSIALIAGLLFVRYGLGFTLSNPLNFLDSYANRSFTFSQRILTQPRIVLMYLSQILIPIAGRLSIEHDIVLSTSLLAPWTTLPSILLILLLISASLFYLKKHPLICFPVLFFFLNHAVESTVLQLELVFEHRNYLPSLFLFLPPGVLIAHILYSIPKQPAFRRIAAVFCSILFLIVSGHATYTRNLAWASEGSLWTDALRKAPQSSRAAHNLGEWHRQFGQYRQAYYYFQLALRHADKAADPKMTKSLALNGLASVAYMLGDYKQSLQYFNQCIEINEKDEACLKNRVLAYLQLGQPEKALSDALRLTQEYSEPIEYQYLTAVSAYRAGDSNTALNRVQKIVNRSLDNHQIMHLAGLLLMKNKAYANSLFFFRQAADLLPTELDYQLSLAASYYLNNDQVSSKRTIAWICDTFPVMTVSSAFKKIDQYYFDAATIGYLKTEIHNSYSLSAR